jgi:hypothetical protein
MNKPEPAFRIPANAEIRNPANWFSPSSLCRTCIYQFLQEETQIDPEISTLSYTEECT